MVCFWKYFFNRVNGEMIFTLKKIVKKKWTSWFHFIHLNVKCYGLTQKSFYVYNESMDIDLRNV